MDEMERLMTVLRRGEVDRVPVVSPLQTATLGLMEETGTYWPDAHLQPEKMARLALAAPRLLGFENVRVPFETSGDASAFDMEVVHRSLRRQPGIIGKRIMSAEGFADLEMPDPHKDGLIPVELEAIRTIKRERPDLPLICGICSPHMLALQLLGCREANRLMTEDTILFSATLHKAKAWVVTHALAAVDAGADAICIIDPLACEGVWNTYQYQVHALPFLRYVCSEVERVGTPVILHSCGDVTMNLPQMSRTGANAISLDYEVDISLAKSAVEGRCAIMGNLSPTALLLRGPVAEIERTVRSCIDAGVDAIAPGCGLAIETPTAHIRAMVDATKAYGIKRPD
jgi:MtaA/CmuA family methyltransferase